MNRATCLRGLVAELAERGLKVDCRAVWNFVHAEKLSFKKTVVASELTGDSKTNSCFCNLQF
jgi:transposase